MNVTKPRDALLDRAVGYFSAHGVGDTSLRTLAAGIDTSHRMLIYHFGSREGLLAAIVERTWDVQQSRLGELMSAGGDPYAGALRFWSQLADDRAFAPLFFEMSAAAMQGRAWAAPLRELSSAWAVRLTSFFVEAGHPPERAAVLGRTAVALVRGVLFELALGGDRATADATIAAFLDSARRD